MASNSLTATCAVFDSAEGRAPRPLFDAELYRAFCEQEGWADAYEGGPVEKNEDLQGLTILEEPYIDAHGNVSALPLYPYI